MEQLPKIENKERVHTVAEVVDLALNEPSPLHPAFSLREDIEGGKSYAMCRTFSSAVQEFLVEKGYDARIVHSDDPENNSHQYIILQTDDMELIIDPTIGQFIKRYGRPFIGSRGELKRLILDPSTEIINTKSRHEPLRAFQRIWGEGSSR